MVQVTQDLSRQHSSQTLQHMHAATCVASPHTHTMMVAWRTGEGQQVSAHWGPLALQHTGQCPPPIPPHKPLSSANKSSRAACAAVGLVHQTCMYHSIHTAQTLHCDTGQHTHVHTHIHTLATAATHFSHKAGANGTQAPGRHSCVQPAVAVLGHRCSRRLKPSGAASPAA